MSRDQSDKLNVSFQTSFDRHDRSVNSVRFSPNGDCLASASDDSAIVIWSKPYSAADAADGVAFGSKAWSWSNVSGSNSKDIRQTLLIGHQSEVFSMAWSPCSTKLISGSTQSRSIIWDVRESALTQILNDHKHMVQGVSWDPADRFLVSQSNDRTCVVYGTPAPEITIPAPKSKPFDEKIVWSKKYKKSHVLKRRVMAIPPTSEEPEEGKKQRVQSHNMYLDENINSYFRRLAWSPDGSILLTPMAQFKSQPGVLPTPTVFVFTRGNFDAPAMHLPLGPVETVGEDGVTKGNAVGVQPAVAVRFSPVLYELRENQGT